MLKNHFKTAQRVLRRQPGFSLINITGLAFGMACCILILLFVQDERAYDRFHEKADRIHRVAADSKLPNAPANRYARSSRPVARVLREEYPEVERVVRLFNQGTPRVKHEGRYFDDDIFYTEPAFFEVFSFPLIAGDAETALAQPYTLVLTESTARKYFGEDEALGRTLTLDDSLAFTITGIAADPPVHSHFSFDILLSLATWEQTHPPHQWEWSNFWMYTYVLLREGASADAFEQKIADLVMRKFGERLKQVGMDVQLALEPLPDIYLRSDRVAQAGPVGDIRYVYAFSTIAFFVLLLACINFMNFSTARSLDRAREVGVRKTVGSSRAALIQQFLSESVLVAGIALFGAVVLVSLALPFFNTLTGKAITADILEQPASLLRLLGLALIVGVLAGSYPAFVLSGFRPVEVLKGRFTSRGRGVRMRQVLVVLQFAVSIVLIVGTLVVYGQLRYMQSQDLGFEKEQVLVVEATGLSGEEQQQHYQTMKQAFLDHPSIEQATASSQVPGAGRGGGVMFPEGLPEGESRRMDYFAVDHDFIETMGIEMVAGRDLSSAFETDAREAALINETAVANIGWGSPEEALGKTIVAGRDGRPLTVVGVFKDYHHLSLRQQIVPTLLLIRPSWFGYYSARITGGQVPQAVAYVEATWNQRFPEHTFTYFFLDEHYDAQYRTERNLMQLFVVFALLAIVIACLGLFGLVLLMTRQRAKEIGIRKALGASSASIVTLLSKDFLKLVLVAFVVAVPVAYVAMNRWLEDFAYRIDLSWGIFLVAGLAALGIAWATVGGQSVRAALTNPVKSLRYE